MTERRELSTASKTLWFLMTSAMATSIWMAQSWAMKIDAKVERIEGLQYSVQYIQKDISEIKDVIKEYSNRGFVTRNEKVDR